MTLNNNDQEEVWDDIKSVWNQSSRANEINYETSLLLAELKSKVSPLEKRLIKNDVAKIKGLVSLFEKESIERDLDLLTKSFKKFISHFKK
jgi:hypothetical protein